MVSGGASNINILIAGRLIQDVGAGGINVLIKIIVCDLLPLRERGRYLGIMFGIIALGTALSPLFGGLIFRHISWRWVFYLNVPIGGVALVILVAFLKVKSDNTPNYIKRLKRSDWLGNVIFVLSMVSILLSPGGKQILMVIISCYCSTRHGISKWRPLHVLRRLQILYQPNNAFERKDISPTPLLSSPLRLSYFPSPSFSSIAPLPPIS